MEFIYLGLTIFVSTFLALSFYTLLLMPIAVKRASHSIGKGITQGRDEYIREQEKNYVRKRV